MGLRQREEVRENNQGTGEMPGGRHGEEKEVQDEREVMSYDKNIH